MPSTARCVAALAPSIAVTAVRVGQAACRSLALLLVLTVSLLIATSGSASAATKEKYYHWDGSVAGAYGGGYVAFSRNTARIPLTVIDKSLHNRRCAYVLVRPEIFVGYASIWLASDGAVERRFYACSSLWKPYETSYNFANDLTGYEQVITSKIRVLVSVCESVYARTDPCDSYRTPAQDY